MKLTSEQLLYILDKLGIDLENRTNLKIIKEEWLSNTSNINHLILLKKILEKLDFDLEKQKNKDFLMKILLTIETYQLEDKKQTNKSQEQLILETMQELKLDPKLKGYPLFLEIIRILLKEEEEYYYGYSSDRKKLHTKKICMKKVLTHLATQLDSTYFKNNPTQIESSIKYAIRNLIKSSEKSLISEKVQTEAVSYMYHQTLSYENSYREYILVFKNYIQILEEKNKHKKK